MDFSLLFLSPLHHTKLYTQMQEKYANGKENFSVFLLWIFVHTDETIGYFDQR